MQNLRTTDPVMNRYRDLEMKTWSIVCEALIPVMVLSFLLPHDGIAVASATGVSISCAYGVVAGALKWTYLNKARALFEKKGALSSYFIGSAINLSLVAVGVLKAFELIAR